MNTEFRVGHGMDCHRLVAGRDLILGGVRIAHAKGLLGHSDADALLHAIMDALLGAAALGDIGEHFPDSDARWAGADSAKLLQSALALVRAEGWRLVNLDCTILAEAPKLTPHKSAMRARIAELLQLSEERINIKAKTMEGLGAVGRGEAMEARAVCLLQRGGDAA